MIASSAVHQFKSRFRGELISPGDQQYDAHAPCSTPRSTGGLRSSPAAPAPTM